MSGLGKAHFENYDDSCGPIIGLKIAFGHSQIQYLNEILQSRSSLPSEIQPQGAK